MILESRFPLLVALATDGQGMAHGLSTISAGSQLPSLPLTHFHTHTAPFGLHSGKYLKNIHIERKIGKFITMLIFIFKIHTEKTEKIERVRGKIESVRVFWEKCAKPKQNAGYSKDPIKIPKRPKKQQYDF